MHHVRVLRTPGLLRDVARGVDEGGHLYIRQHRCIRHGIIGRVILLFKTTGCSGTKTNNPLCLHCITPINALVGTKLGILVNTHDDEFICVVHYILYQSSFFEKSFQKKNRACTRRKTTYSGARTTIARTTPLLSGVLLSGTI